MSDLILLLSGSLCLCLIFGLIKIFYQLWLAPIRLQKLLGMRGIRGPNYKFIHGNSKEIMAMQKEATSRPMNFSDHNIFPKLQPHIHRWTNLYGKCYLQWDGLQAEVVVTEPNLVKDILSDKDGVYSKGETKPFLKKLLGDGLVTSHGDKWRKVRKLANFAFHSESLKRMIPAMIESTEMMLENWKQKEDKEVEAYEEFRLLTSEIISRTAFGSSFMEGRKIFELLNKLTLLSYRNYYKITLPVINKVFKSRDEIESEKVEKEVRELIIDLVRKRESTGEREFGSDFLELLVKAQHDGDESERISIDDVVDECKTFYFGGQETTSNLLAWTMFLLAIHDDWQEKAREEVLNVFGNGKPDDLSKLKIMGMIINESLRLYPPAVVMNRYVEKEARLGSLTLPKGLKVLISNLSLHHDSRVWGQEAHRFKPERFSEGVASATKNNMAAFIPFGTGPRTCVGFNFAVAEAKVALAMILQRYAFTLSPTYVHSPVQVVTNRPQYGIHVTLIPL